MKKLLTVVLSVVALAAFAKANGSLKFIPAKVDGIICVDSAKGMNNSFVSKTFNSNPQFNASRDKLDTELKAYGLKTSDMIQDLTIFISQGNPSGAVVQTKVSNKLFKKMLSNGFFKKLDPSSKITKSESAGNTVYLVSTSSIRQSMSKISEKANVSVPEKVAFSYVDANHVLFADPNEIGQILGSLKSSCLANNNSFQSKLKEINTDSLVWLLFNIPEAAQAKGINLVGCTLNVTEKQNDININGFVRCKSDQLAMQYAQQAQFMIMMFSGGVFKGDQQLAMDVSKAIKITNKANDIKLNVVIPENMQTKLKAFAEKSEKEKLRAIQPNIQ